MKDLRNNVLVALNRKGFQVDVVQTETEFINRLKSSSVDIAWLISSDALDWNTREPIELTKWRALADACEFFHRSGRGLFIFADNAPFLDHANVVLERLVQAELEGSTPGKKILSLGDANSPEHFGEHLITCGITGLLYEGNTICFPKKLGKLEVLATSSDKRPAIMFAESGQHVEKGFGRIVVDTGFTKLWLEWNSAGTERYICNATVWLLGLDYRMNNNIRTLKGPICSTPITGGLRTPDKIPKETTDGRADVVLILDGSGSVGSENFQKMKEFSKKLIRAVNVSRDGIHFSIVQFSNYAAVISLSGDPQELCYKIDNDSAMRYMCGGTNFDVALERACEEVKLNGREGLKKIFLFQTDGECSTSFAPKVHALGIEVYAAGVGAVSMNGLQALASKPKESHIFNIDDYAKVDELKDKFANAVLASCRR